MGEGFRIFEDSSARISCRVFELENQISEDGSVRIGVKRGELGRLPFPPIGFGAEWKIV